MDNFNATYKPNISNKTYMIFFITLVQYGMFTIISPLLMFQKKYYDFVLTFKTKSTSLLLLFIICIIKFYIRIKKEKQ